MSDKKKYEIEFPLRTSSKVLYTMLSTPSGLSEWFCDNVNLKEDVFTFIWDGSEEQARLLTKKNGESVKFRWMEAEEEGDSSYFELRIQIDSITKDVALIVTDFAEEDEVEESKRFWIGQLTELKQVLGA
jgi:hypothetical protein